MPADTRQDPSQTAIAGTWRNCVRTGTHLAARGQYAQAAAHFREAARLRETHPATQQALGTVLLKAGEPGKAALVFSDLTRLIPENAACWHGLGLARHALNDRGGAIDAMRRATMLDPLAWRSHASVAELTPDETERIDSIGAAALGLECVCNEPGASPRLILNCANALMDAHRFEEAARLIETSMEQLPDRASAHDRLGRAYYWMGAFEAAFEQKRLALLCTTARKPLSRKAFDPRTAVGVLAEICALLSVEGFTPFLAAGTLLGFVRNGGPLAHDRDVDIGLLHKTGPRPDIASVLRRHPRFILAREARPGERYFALTADGVGVDIFIYTQREGHVFCGFSDLAGDIQWRFSQFHPAATQFNGFDCHVPCNPERYLQETYGIDWKTPDKGFASAIRSPALFRTDPHARAFYSATRARQALLSGDPAKARALVAQSPVPLAAEGSRP